MANSTAQPPFMPPRWVIRTAWRIHRGLYRLTNKRFGLRRPKPDQEGLLHLTAVGRRSGENRSVMLAYVEDGPDLVTMAMNGWGEGQPAWWLNLQADPRADVELPDRTVQVRARPATTDEHERLWDLYRAVDAKLDAYAARRSTETTMVVLEPTA